MPLYTYQNELLTEGNALARSGDCCCVQAGACSSCTDCQPNTATVTLAGIIDCDGPNFCRQFGFGNNVRSYWHDITQPTALNATHVLPSLDAGPSGDCFWYRSYDSISGEGIQQNIYFGPGCVPELFLPAESGPVTYTVQFNLQLIGNTYYARLWVLWAPFVSADPDAQLALFYDSQVIAAPFTCSSRVFNMTNRGLCGGPATDPDFNASTGYGNYRNGTATVTLGACP